MVWSDSGGTSIVLPSDRVAGDGRNYIVIGEDVPTSIADEFTAALVFRNALWTSETDPPVGSSILGYSVGNLYPDGFVYWAIGISKNGGLEVVGYYLVVPSPMAEQVITYRQTMMSFSPPVGVGNPTVLSIGENTNYGTYNEGAVKVVMTAPTTGQPYARLRQTVASGSYPVGYGTISYGTADIDTHSGFVIPSGQTFSTKYTFPMSGLYAIEGCAAINSVTSGQVGLARLMLNGAVVLGSMGDLEHPAATDSVLARTGRTLLNVNQGDYIEMQAYCSNGWSTRVTADGACSTLTIERLSERTS